MSISNLHRNSLGTTSFDGKFSKMRKASDFIVYPLGEGEHNTIAIQSNSRFGRIEIATGKLVLSASHTFANSVTLIMDTLNGKATTETLPQGDLDTLLGHIRGTASPMAGGNNVMRIYCENSGASKI